MPPSRQCPFVRTIAASDPAEFSNCTKLPEQSSSATIPSKLYELPREKCTRGRECLANGKAFATPGATCKNMYTNRNDRVLLAIVPLPMLSEHGRRGWLDFRAGCAQIWT